MSNARVFCSGAALGLAFTMILTFAVGEPKHPWEQWDFAARLGIFAVLFFGDRKL